MNTIPQSSFEFSLYAMDLAVAENLPLPITDVSGAQIVVAALEHETPISRMESINRVGGSANVLVGGVDSVRQLTALQTVFDAVTSRDEVASVAASITLNSFMKLLESNDGDLVLPCLPPSTGLIRFVSSDRSPVAA